MMKILRQTNLNVWFMRLTCLLLALGITGGQLLSARTLKAQDMSDARVTLDLRNESLKTAFTVIEKQTEFRFAYNQRQVDRYKNITLTRNNAPLPEVLNDLLAGTKLAYKQVSNKIVVFQPAEEKKDDPAPAVAAEPGLQSGGTIRGSVIDDKGTPVGGASIQLVGRKRGEAADAGGHFELKDVPAGRVQVRVSAVGYQTVLREVVVTEGQASDLQVQLTQVSGTLNEVVVTGYSKQSRRDVTGAASTVSQAQIEQSPVATVESAIEGRVSGVSVDDQGGPGANQTIRIRGIGTLLNNDPLYVIDGVQIRLGQAGGSENISNLLDPGEIESITVLKDPSMTALYGAEGSNGVIVITTKTGRMGAPRLDYNFYMGVEAPKNLPNEITPQQQANALYQSYHIAGMPFGLESMYDTSSGSPALPAYIIESVGTQNTGVSAGSPLASPSLYNYQNYRIIKTNPSGTNWWRVLFNPAMTQSHELTLSGATDKSNYALGLGYLDQQGTLLNSYFQRISLRANTQFKIKPWLRFGENAEISYATQNSLSRGATNDIDELYLFSPLLPKYDIAGNFAGTHEALTLGSVNSPFADRMNAVNNKSYSQSIVGTAYGELEPIKGLIYTNQIGFQFFPSEYHGYSPADFYDPVPIPNNIFTEGGSYSSDWRWLNKLAYTFTIKDIHRISAFVGYESSEFASRSYYGTTGNIGFASTNTQYLGNGNTGTGTSVIPSVGGTGALYTTASMFGNVTYSLMDKYLATATFRRDGSSNFGPGDRYGNFGAGSVGWRISGEKFMQPIKWVNDLKLRAAYGAVGNDAGNAAVTYQATLASGPFGDYDLAGTNVNSLSGYYPYQLGNQKLHWESNVTANIGFDASLFSNHLTGSFNWFSRETKGLIYAPPSSGTAGSALSPFENVMNFTNRGVELEAGYNDHIGRDFSFQMDFNISSYKNNVSYIDGLPGAFIEGGVFGSNNSIFLTRSTVGKPVSSFYGYVYQGLFQSSADVANSPDESSLGITAANGAGHVKYKDLNGDKIINLSDETYIGNPNPKFSYGYDLNLYYKHFDIGIFLQGVYGNKIDNYAKTMELFQGGNFDSQVGGLFPGALDTWTPSNPNAKVPIFSQQLGPYDLSPSSYFIESGSYLRLKTLQVGYTIPKLKGIRKLRIYVQAYNLLTITKYSGMDPAVNDGDPHDLGIDYGTAYPISKKYIVGVNLGL